MPNPAADRWNEKYRRESDLWLEREPRQLLTSFVHLLPDRGRALDAACGVGTNAIFLAENGLNVIGIDISEHALRLALRRAKKLGYSIEVAVADLSHPWLPGEYFDVITNFHFLERATIPVYRQALKSGGLILFDTFLATRSAVNTPSYYLEPGELLHLFDEFEIIHYAEESLEAIQSHGERGAAQLVARKPVGIKY
jgi:2-polyprenyl-3-methyl-5-hydroxy-6-metoxy-1,4-benzoquinol methylase